MTAPPEVAVALRTAEAARLGERPVDSPAPRRWYVVGDPQAPARRFMEVLAAHGALGPEGWLAADVGLVSVGDHFDFKEPEGVTVEEVGREGETILAWLAAHPPEQVVVLLGNHDLSRVMELAGCSDEGFAAARALAVEIRARVSRGEEAAELLSRFWTEHASIPTPGLAARDYSAFSEAQRALVQRLLVTRRARLASVVELAAGATALATHAGVTRRELSLLELDEERDPARIAEAIEDRLRAAVDAVRPRWEAGENAPLDLSPLHEMGRAGREGGGLCYHRPAHPDRERDRPRPGSVARRRYPPQDLPLGVTQIVGHIDHDKCLEELAGFDVSRAVGLAPGALRRLSVGERVRYEPFAPDPAVGGGSHASLILCDGGMNRVARAEDYRLLPIRGVVS